ncbi:hypothetical protein D0860_02289 [Hortaea werneckii]|uniref:Ribosomal protein S2 n=1 Tax=Hortaea werneckii TaxID=91943 RepID=A0A3M7HL68_HORWE|nr:hypothetical protein D0860_02289 [Hortaea werneckii]
MPVFQSAYPPTMIIRSLLLRHGRLALPRAPSPSHLRSWRRTLTTASEVESSYTNPQSAQNYIAGGLGSATKGQAVQNLTSASQPPTIALEDEQVVRDWEFFHHQKQRTQHLGSALEPYYRPHELVANPPSPKDITLELLLASQTHIGHATSLWHPANAKYIFGVRGEQDPIHIISLDVTAAHLRRASKVVRGVTERGGLVLFVGSRAGQSRSVVRAAELSGGCHLFSKWIPGSITNGQQILGKCRKKVVDQFDTEQTGFEEQLHSKAALKPDLVVCLNPLENYVLLHECGLNNIPTIGIIDTDANPTWVTYPIPANDDSLRSVQMIAGVLGRAGQEGQQIRRESAAEGVVNYRQDHGLEPPSRESDEAKQRREKEQSLLAGADAFEVSEAALEMEDESVGVEKTGVTAETVANTERLMEVADVEVDAGAVRGVEKGDVPYEVDAPVQRQGEEGGQGRQGSPFAGRGEENEEKR